ncbi:MAG: putative sugar O-methyltransferase [Pseudomonadota bacterium]
MKQLKQRILNWTRNSDKQHKAKRLSTSLSDNQLYPQACLDAATNYELFNEFKRHPTYNRILEHVSESQGQEYLNIISNHPDMLEAIEKFKENDKWGNPRVYDYTSVGSISPTTLRYIKVLVDLRIYFQDLNDLEICEIGVGYGGQCRIINAYFKLSNYCLVDIQPALALTQRFLDNFIIDGSLSYQTMNELAPKNYDLCISNYAFTELPRTVQDVYLHKVILNSTRGYITYNEITPKRFNSYKADELVATIPGAKILEEKPLTHPKNCIIVWGDDF